jgi:hypothetical protein
MSDKPRLKVVAADGIEGIKELWLDPKLGDGITDTHWHDIPIGKPKAYFRVSPLAEFKRRTEIYVHKTEDEIGEEYYIVGPQMRGRIAEARPCTIVTCVYRDGSPRLWPLMFPREGEKDNAAWKSARKAARTAMEKWVKLSWVGRAYTTTDALKGYAPDPDYTKLPTFDEMIQIALGEHGIIRAPDHPIYRELVGAPPEDESGLEAQEPSTDDDLGESA